MCKTGNVGMCETKHPCRGDGNYCSDCGHLRRADCHINPTTVGGLCSWLSQFYSGLHIVVECYEGKHRVIVTAADKVYYYEIECGTSRRGQP